MDKADDPDKDFWGQYRTDQESAQSVLYRYEHDGIVVYDSCARLSNQECLAVQLERNTVTGQTLRDLEGAGEYGKELLRQVPVHSHEGVPAVQATDS